MPRSRIINNSTEVSASVRLCSGVLLVVAVLIALHPISSHDFWWQLSRGRAVLDGTLAPAGMLLAGEASVEADWLGGVPVYVLFSFGGAAALMLLKLLAVCVVAIDLFFLKSQRQSLCNLAFVLLALLAARQAWEPTSLFYDTVGVTIIWWAAESFPTHRYRGRLAFLLLTMLAWANFSPLCVLGIPVALSALNTEPRSTGTPLTARQRAGIVAMLAVACCVTPRGPATLWDSIRLVIPTLTTSAAVIQSTPWQPLALTIHNPESVAFVALSVAALVALVRAKIPVGSLLTFFTTQMLVWSSQTNLAPAAIWLVLVLLRQLQVSDVAEARQVDSRYRTTRFEKMLPAMVVMLIAVAAVHRWPGSMSRCGWGIDPSIGGAAFDESLKGIRTTGTAHCVGIREAGLLCWFKPDGARPFDTPRQSLLSGRLQENVQLNEEFSSGWQIPHRREDGSWGGWWLTRKERDTTLLIVPADVTGFIRALEPTKWKPLTLDGPSLIFGLSGDPDYSPQIARMIQLRQHVDQNVWSYSPSAAAGDDSHLDLVGLLTGQTDNLVDLRLAKVFRAMHFNIAALRVLHPLLRQQNSQMTRDEFARNQLELGYKERLAIGRSSLFRSTAFRKATVDPNVGLILMETLNADFQPEAVPVDAINTAVKAYLTGEIDHAIGKLSDDHPELIYARALLMLESGKPNEAADACRILVTKFPDDRLSVAGRNVFNSL